MQSVDTLSSNITWLKADIRAGLFSFYTGNWSCVGRYTGGGGLVLTQNTFSIADGTRDSYQLSILGLASFSTCNSSVAAATIVGQGESTHCSMKTPLICKTCYHFYFKINYPLNSHVFVNFPLFRISVASALPYSWLNVWNASEAGQEFLFLFDDSTAQLANTGTELAVALLDEALTSDSDVLQSFTFVDFIVSSAKSKDSIEERGIGNKSSDVTGTYSIEADFTSYLAARIPFSSFAVNGQSQLVPNNLNARVTFIFGNGNCPAGNDCENEMLLPNSEYW